MDGMPRHSCMEPSNSSRTEKPTESDSEERQVAQVSDDVPLKSSEDLPVMEITCNEEMITSSDTSLKKKLREEKAECSFKETTTSSEVAVAAAAGEECGRERLKKHRMEMAGRVWIPETWGQESLLKDWVDCSAFDDSLVPKGLMMAREALVEGGRRTTADSRQLRLENLAVNGWPVDHGEEG